jgi:hypothetical protein
MHQSPLRFRADLKSINITCIACIESFPINWFQSWAGNSFQKTSNKLINRQRKCEMNEWRSEREDYWSEFNCSSRKEVWSQKLFQFVSYRFRVNETEELMSRCCRSIAKRARGTARLSAEDPKSDISSSRKSRKCDTHTIASWYTFCALPGFLRTN